MPRDKTELHHNFLYGYQGQKSKRPGFWGCKRASGPLSGSRAPANHDSPSCHTTFDTGVEMPQSTQTPSPVERRAHHHSQGGVHVEINNTRRMRHATPAPPTQPPGFPPSQPPPPFAMHPFSRLATTVKQCPWMLGSDVNPFAHDHNSDFYPPVPRSLKHDSAVSFVVTDQTRPEQPQFVVSCPLEHVEFVKDMLAPAGSQRTLSARGSSGTPRDGAELRSMLLDGTPNIELALSGSVETKAGEERGGDGQGGGGGSSPDGSRSSSAGDGYGPPPWARGVGSQYPMPPAFAVPPGMGPCYYQPSARGPAQWE